MRSMLCIDDMEEDLQALELQFSKEYKVICCSDSRSALSLAKKHKPAAVILDLQMPGYDGFQVLSDLKKLAECPPVLMLSGHAAPIFVVRALKEGAADFMEKPYNIAMLKRRLQLLIQRHTTSKWSLNEKHYPCFIGSSPTMIETVQKLKTFANAQMPVLISGESGTGKDMAARLLHTCSNRHAGPYIVRNIGALPETLIESELFGCEAGAYTDAKPRKGCFEEANGGTLFLDEIDSASPRIQAALLRSVEEGAVRRIGGNKFYQADCRLVFATNKDIDTLIQQNKFREDLKFRINGLNLHLAPLREHRQDIPELVHYFMQQNNGNGKDQNIDVKALDYLMAQRWPGNVRQLKACIEKALILAGEGTIQQEHVLE